jgi:hypothetical protein
MYERVQTAVEYVKQARWIPTVTFSNAQLFELPMRDDQPAYRKDQHETAPPKRI